MKLENPWIAAECRQHQVAPNGLGTYLQEQYGQLGEDLILEAVLRSLLARSARSAASLRYLEVGANHPIQTSNTYLFYRKWQARGVLVEANPRLIEALQQVRSGDLVLNLAVTPAGHGAEAELVVAQHSELSSLDAGHVASFGAQGRVAEKVRVPTASLDTLLERHFAGGLDVLSIDIEGLDLQVLREATLKVRPACIVAEPSRHYQKDAEQQFASVLSAQGYVEVARTDYNLIYMDRAQLPGNDPVEGAPKQALQTFDIFDTLIARHCIQPELVFDAVERACQQAGFAAARAQAERAVAHAEYGLVDIYRELQRILGVTEERTQELLVAELQEELANVVPIAENIARLTPDSVLVTDMYLPPEALRPLLAAAGIATDLPIVQTSDGKRSGQVWKALGAAGYDCRHLGDNRHSDHDMALAAGMRPQLQSLATLTTLEAGLLDAGFAELPRALRSARLMTRLDSLTPEQRRLQAEFNLPFLVACAVLIRGHAMAHNLERVAFAARDGLHLKLVYDGVAAALGGGPASTYWHTSRVARTASDAQYLEYCRRVIDARTLVVDLCGTGTSLLRLYGDLGCLDAPPQTLLCQKLNDEALARSFATDYGVPPSSRLNVLNVVEGGFCPNEDLEILNYVPHGMLLTVRRLGAEWLPLRAPYEFDGAARASIERQHQVIAAAARNLSSVMTAAAAAEIEARGAQVFEALRARAAGLEIDRATLRNTFLPEHRAFEAQTRRRLKRSPS